MFAPFLPPLNTELTPCAWRGGAQRTPTWRYVFGDWIGQTPPAVPVGLDPASVHALLRAAGLPRAELLHMGWPEWALSASTPPLAPDMVAPLLGRIALDAHYHQHGGAWPEGAAIARRLGGLVLDRWFHG